ncbi:MAG: MBL fold metallo-hydrolase [Gemmatimonadales bacterium]|nr:MBL fold metallo-hydrolase [Gemmatimonadales bacterium]
MSGALQFKVGRLTCWTLEGGLQRLDGGDMFGVVPKPLWERRIPADERNRIPLAMRCLLVEHPDGLVLIDTGLGNKENAKFLDIYGVENAGMPGPTTLEDSLRAAGHRPEDVRWVINTHLHFDHAGGNTVKRENGAVEVTFPNATYVVQRRELDFASSPNERIRASYLAPNFAPITALDRWRLLDGETDVLPGIRAIPTPGHVPYHQSILVSDSGESACVLGDLVPTSAHLPAPWIMGYDLEPLVTLATKKAFLPRAAREGWQLVFEHDPVVARGRVGRDEKKGWTTELAEKVAAGG